MTDTNKVEYGLSEIHVGTYTVGLNGEVTMGPPYRMPGAVALNLDPETEENSFYADNVKYYSNYQDNGFTGSLEMARFPDKFKTQFLGYVELYNVSLGGIKVEKGTKEASTEPKTQSIDMTVTGDNATGIIMAEYTQDVSGYSTLFTNPPAPTLPVASE